MMTEQPFPKTPTNRPFWVLFLSGSISVLPVGIVTLVLFSRWEGHEIGHLQAIPLFLQGSTDWGGSNTYSATMAAYVVMGFHASVYLTLLSWLQAPSQRYLLDLLNALKYLGTHVAAFVTYSLLFWPMAYSYDADIFPNDFRNMFILALLLYTASIFWIVWISRRGLGLSLRLVLGPAFIILWLVVGNDGTTAKAGQVLNAGVEPSWAPRSTRHGLMLTWHRLCDKVLGDVGDARGHRPSASAPG